MFQHDYICYPLRGDGCVRAGGAEPWSSQPQASITDLCHSRACGRHLRGQAIERERESVSVSLWDGCVVARRCRERERGIYIYIYFFIYLYIREKEREKERKTEQRRTEQTEKGQKKERKGKDRTGKERKEGRKEGKEVNNERTGKMKSEITT